MSYNDLNRHIATKNTWGALGDISGLIAGAPVALAANYTLQASDNGVVFRTDGSSAITLTVPNNLPVGFNVGIVQWGTGVVTLTAGSGATKRGSGSTSVQYAFTNVYVAKNADGATAEFVVLGGA